MNFEYLINQKEYETNIDKFWKFRSHNSYVWYHIVLLALFFTRLIPVYINRYINNELSFTDTVAVILVCVVFYVIGLADARLKRRHELTIPKQIYDPAPITNNR